MSTALPKDKSVIRQRKVSNKGDLGSSVFTNSTSKHSNDKNISEKSCIASKLDYIVSGLSDKWKNYVIRTLMAIVMLSSFTLIIFLGPIALVFMLTVIQLMFFNEIINIGYVVYKSHDLPWFRTLSWFFLFTSNYFFFGEGLIAHFRILFAKENLMQSLITHHRFISFCLYIFGFVMFVLSLVKKHYLQQFTLFGWTHLILVIIVTSTHFMMLSIFNGLIWSIVPISMVVLNDITAYLFGFFLGRTPLIKLSPKKTWEGFIGGGLSTVVFAVFFSLLLIQFDYFVCPLEYDDVKGDLSMECVRGPMFKSVFYGVPEWMWFLPVNNVIWYPFLKHSIIMALFSSVVAPFGGFFASGFKRAFKIKDFSDMIPGHGGIVDRCDCQILMGTFVYLYYNSFIRTPGPSTILQHTFSLSRAEQLEFYWLLTTELTKRGIIAS